MISDQGATHAGFWSSRSMAPMPMTPSQQKQLQEEEKVRPKSPRLLRAAIDLNVGVVDPAEIDCEAAPSCRTDHGGSVDIVERSSSSAMAAVAAAGIWKEQLLAGWFPKWHDLFNGFLPNKPIAVPVLAMANSCASPPPKEKPVRLHAESSSTEADHLHTPEARVMADDCPVLLPDASFRTPASEPIIRHSHGDFFMNSPPPPIPVPSPAWLPQGWVTELHTRRTGTTAGIRDKYYKEVASGRRFRSRTEVFNFIRTGKGRIRSRRRKKLAFLTSSDGAMAVIASDDTEKAQANTDSMALVVHSDKNKNMLTIDGPGPRDCTSPNQAQMPANDRSVPIVVAAVKTETGDTGSTKEAQRPANNAAPRPALDENQMNLLLRRLETCNNNNRLRLLDMPSSISPVSPISLTERSKRMKMTEIPHNSAHQQVTPAHKRSAPSSPSPKSPSKTQLKKAKMESLKKSEAKQASRLWQWLHQSVVRNHDQQQPPAKTADTDKNLTGDPEAQMIDKKSCSDQKQTNSEQHVNGGSTQRTNSVQHVNGGSTQRNNSVQHVNGGSIQRTVQLSREIEEAQKSMMKIGREMQASVEKMSKELQMQATLISAEKLRKEPEQVAMQNHESNLAVCGSDKSELKQQNAASCDRKNNETQIKSNSNVNTLIKSNENVNAPATVVCQKDVSIALSNSNSMVGNRSSNIEPVISMDGVIPKIPKPIERRILNLNRSIISLEINLNQKPDLNLEDISIDNHEQHTEATYESLSSEPASLSKQSSTFSDKQRYVEGGSSVSCADKERSMKARSSISYAEKDSNVDARNSSSHNDRDKSNIESTLSLSSGSLCLDGQSSDPHVDNTKEIHSLPSGRGIVVVLPECKGITKHRESGVWPDDVKAKPIEWSVGALQNNNAEGNVKTEHCLLKITTEMPKELQNSDTHQIGHDPCMMIDVEKPCSDADMQMCIAPQEGIHGTLQCQQNLADAAMDNAIHEDKKDHSTDLVVYNSDMVNSIPVEYNGSMVCSSRDEMKSRKLLSTTRSRGVDSMKCKIKRRNAVLNPTLDLSGLNPNLTSRQRAKMVQKMKAAHARELLASLGRKICRTLPIINNI